MNTGLNMAVEDVPVDTLQFDPANVRKHPEANLAAIKASLSRFGQQKPIVVGTGNVVVAGNGTLAAAKALGWRTVKAVRTTLAGAEATAFAIADNRTAELAEWDEASLHQQLAAIAIDDEELLAATGFDEKELAKLAAAAAPDVTEDEVPEPPADPITQPGDLWVLGNHRLLCGDSTKAEDVERLMDGDTAALMVTDPPYGVNYDESWRECSSNDFGGHTKGTLQNDDRADWVEAYRLADASVAYVWHASSNAHVVRQNLLDSGFDVRQQVMWRKPFGVMSRSAYHWQHEPCWYAVRKNRNAAWIGTRTETTVWEATIPNHPMAADDDTRTEHPTQKPIEVMARAIRNHDAPLVYDPFLGSGTTLIAAEQLGRTCYGMEISPAYCDVIVKRWETLTGRKAERQSA